MRKIYIALVIGLLTTTNCYARHSFYKSYDCYIDEPPDPPHHQIIDEYIEQNNRLRESQMYYELGRHHQSYY